MGKILTDERRLERIQRHKSEREKYICDRLKAVLAYDDGHSPERGSASILLLQDEETVRRHIREYQRFRKLKPENEGCKSKRTEEQTQVGEAT